MWTVLNQETRMKTSLEEHLTYYAQPGPFSSPGKHAGLLAGLPTSLPELVKVVQNTLIHVFWAERYGVKLSDAQQATLQMRSLEEKLAALKAEGWTSLLEPRTPEQRQVGNCRDFSLLLASILRFQGVPARARCGFGTYFLPDHFEDHWVVEYWNGQRWVMVDAQLDALQQGVLKLDFDPLDMPPGKFVTGGQAWQMARRGEQDPDKFGIFDMHGLWFIAGDLVRDFLSLVKVEILPWDHAWGMLSGDDAITGAESERNAIFDHLAALTIPGEEDFDEVQRLYQSDPRLQPPQAYFERTLAGVS
jgi:hypothetical protein